MKKITAAIAAALAFNVANAAQITLPNTGATLTFSDAFTIKSLTQGPGSSDKFELVAEIPSGVSTLSYSFASTQPIYSSFFFGSEVLKYEDGFRSGQYKLTATPMQLSDGASVTTFFTRGTWLLPSENPECASVLCMVPVRDRAFVSFTVFADYVPIVPEPSTYAMLAATLAAAAGISARRRRQNS